MTEDILTVNELFSGIGAQRKALLRLGIPHEVVGVCEIDKYAIQSYEAIYGETKNYGDICTAPRLDYADLWTYSFPCQDISVAGKQQGISENTRSGLLYQVQRLLEVAKDEGTLPKYLLLENVKNLVGKQFKSQFEDWLFYLDELGYDSYWQVLNAKNYGIPQNRERVFAVSIRKDLNQTFEFPKAEELTIRLKDVLEDEVDEKFYISQDKVEKFIKNIGIVETPCIAASRGRYIENTDAGEPTEQKLEINTQGTTNTITTVQKDNYVIEKKILDVSYARLEGKFREYNEIAPTLTARDYKEPRLVSEAKIQQVGNIVSTGNWDNPQRGRIYSPEGLSPALNTVGGGGLEPKIVEVGHYTYPNSDKKHQSNVVFSAEGLAPTLDTMQGGNRQPKILENQIQKFDIPQKVKVRKYEIDNTKLVELLRNHKNLTNKQIADALNVPLTKVEHWFRADSSFAIPDAEIWFQLKELLNIQTTEFDDAITTFEVKEGVYEKSNRCYLDSGIAPTLTSSSCDEKIITNLRIRKITPLEAWRLMGFDDEDFYKAQQSGVSNSQLYKQAGNSIVVNVLEKIFNNLCK